MKSKRWRHPFPNKSPSFTKLRGCLKIGPPFHCESACSHIFPYFPNFSTAISHFGSLHWHSHQWPWQAAPGQNPHLTSGGVDVIGNVLASVVGRRLADMYMCRECTYVFICIYICAYMYNMYNMCMYIYIYKLYICKRVWVCIYIYICVCIYFCSYP